MNTEGLERIHPDFLEVGKQYVLSSKSLKGEAVVEVLGKTIDGIEVEVQDGGFAPPLRKRVVAGDTLTVDTDSGIFYQAKE